MDIAAKITSKGQITIPKAVRDALNLGEGDQVVCLGDPVRVGVALTGAVVDPGALGLEVVDDHGERRAVGAARPLEGLGERLADVEGVAEAYSVTGEWDFVAIIRVPRHEMLADVVTGELVKLPGVSRTQTMVAFEVFSRHDLEAMFSIGG